MTTMDKIARRKLSLLELASELSNVSKACKLAGYSRQQFYEIRRKKLKKLMRPRVPLSIKRAEQWIKMVNPLLVLQAVQVLGSASPKRNQTKREQKREFPVPTVEALPRMNRVSPIHGKETI